MRKSTIDLATADPSQRAPTDGQPPDAPERADRRPRRHASWPLVAGVLMLAVLATAAVVLPDVLEADDNEPSAALLAATEAPSVAVSTGSAAGAIASEEAVVPAANLRLLLEQLLGEHLLVMAGASADAADGGSLGAALDAVQPNTDALADAIELVYGEAGARAFTSLWTQHVAFFIDRGAAAGRDDQRAMETADAHLHHYERDFGSFTQSATAGELPADVVTFLLEGHVADINTFVAAHLAGDGEAAAQELAIGHGRVADIGAGLAAAISTQGPAAFPGESAGGGVDRASTVGRTLAAHLAATSLQWDAPDTRDELREEVILALAAVSDDPEATRTAATEWLQAEGTSIRPAAEALGEQLAVDDPTALTDALVVYQQGLGSELLEAPTADAHTAAYVIAGALLGR